ncbi:peptidase S9 [Neptunitalea chrysea]|uniref:Peptidase S9 n=1 Tax=Neptunitalea chrysea TaxID=1647581 RepID=A0A9W6EUQ0_9FLAO|nr:S9 family peptidase [Neptunitalea chrysea]GLB53780.1 peptidase S9 [Neptunitalea chrysea]
MNKYRAFLFAFVAVSTQLFAQTQQITLEEIWNGGFRTQGMDELNSLNNGKQYAVLNFDRATRTTSVDKYDYETLEKTGTIVSSADIEEMPYFLSYKFSADESKILLAGGLDRIYRHSTLGVYFVYDVTTKKVTKVSDDPIQEPTFSPDGTKVAYVKDANIYIKSLTDGKVTQVTTDGAKNAIINGVTDWVYEEEFAFVRAFEWNKTSDRIAFLRFDETEVPEFSMDIFGKELYPTEDTFKYPKAGEKNSDVTLHVYNVSNGETAALPLEEYEYIPRIEFTEDAQLLAVQTLNRHQNDLKLYFYNVDTKKATVTLHETDEAYIDITDNLTFLADNSFIWTSEKDGFNHIYHYDSNGKLLNQVTSGAWEVTAYYGYNPKEKRIYYQSVENGSINRDVYSIKLNGKSKKHLSTRVGTNDATFSANFSYFINTYSSVTTPYRYTLNSAKDGKELKEIVANTAVKEKLNSYGVSDKEFSTIKVNGNDLNMWMIKPANFDPNKKYPLFMYQYSGPGSQQVANAWYGINDYWFFMLAQQGYVVACVDGRGTGFKGAAFKKVTQKQLGKYEVEDQIEAAKLLGKRSYIDAGRIGIWGWSYGGFMSSNCLLKGNDVFSMAIAVAPVTSWRFYDSIYTERYMTTPQENPEGYDDNSPLFFADQLTGKFLLVHGSADDNVHLQNSMRMIEALVQANKQFDWAIYPDKNHGIYGGNTRLHLYTKLTNFIKENL